MSRDREDLNMIMKFFLFLREKSKQLAEQGSAIVCLESIGIDLTRAKYGMSSIKTLLSNENKIKS